eukprot:2637811-Prymnesium_polylepis.1
MELFRFGRGRSTAERRTELSGLPSAMIEKSPASARCRSEASVASSASLSQKPGLAAESPPKNK